MRRLLSRDGFSPITKRCLALALGLVIGSSSIVIGRAEPPVSAASAVNAADLAVIVGDLAESRGVGRATKERQISEAVRLAVAAAIGRKADPEEAVASALKLAAMAAAAAPQFTEVIANAIAFAPTLARIPGARDRIRTAAYAAARSAGDAAPVAGGAANSPPGRASSLPPESPYGKNSAWTVSAVTAVRRDDNVYLNSANQIADTIITVAPGVTYRFGRQTLVQGSIGVRTAFVKYLDGAAPNANLSSGDANLSYEAGNVGLSAGASYHQLQQNTGDVVSLGARELFRSNVLNLGSTVHLKVSERVGVQSGANLSQTKYKSAGLVGSDEVKWPVSVSIEASPKVNLTAGFSYGSVKPLNDGPAARDLFYNTGIWGQLTPKLAAQFTVGYRTREVGLSPREGMWAFDGVFNYALTAKSGLALVLARNFGAGALGDSLKSTNYSLRFTSDPAPHWNFAATLTHRTVDYGNRVFVPRLKLLASAREDSFWENAWQATYRFSQSFSVSLDATLRNNDSTLNGVDFSNRIVGLSFAYQF